MRVALSTDATDILPSPIFPVLAAAWIDFTVFSLPQFCFLSLGAARADDEGSSFVSFQSKESSGAKAAEIEPPGAFNNNI